MSAAANNELGIEVFESGSVITMVMSGEIHLGNVREVENAWDAQMEKSPTVIGINCLSITFMDSSAIGSLVKFHNHAIHLQIKLVLIELNPSLSKIFSAAKLDRIFTVLSQEDFTAQFLSA